MFRHFNRRVFSCFGSGRAPFSGLHEIGVQQLVKNPLRIVLGVGGFPAVLGVNTRLNVIDFGTEKAQGRDVSPQADDEGILPALSVIAQIPSLRFQSI